MSPEILSRILARLDFLEAEQRRKSERARRRTALLRTAGKLCPVIAFLGLATWVLAQGLEVKTTDSSTDIQRMKIETSSGVGVAANAYFMNANLGIGTTSPARRLHAVSTDAPAILADRQQTVSPSAVWIPLTVKLTYTAGQMADGFGPGIRFEGRDVDGVDNYLASVGARREGADDTGGLAVFTVTGGSSSEKMRVSNAGNVGIGTTAPAVPLHVTGSTWANGTGGDLRVVGSNTVGAGVTIQSSDAGGRIWSLLSTGSTASGGAGNFGIYDNSATNYKMYIESGGDVGIGILDPDTRLHVAAAADSLLHLQATDSGINNSVAIDFTTFSGAGLTGRIASWDEGGWNGSLRFYTDNDGVQNSNLTERMRIRANGDLDIAPAANESSIWGMDQLVGYNDLRFYCDDTATNRLMLLDASGNLSNDGAFTFENGGGDLSTSGGVVILQNNSTVERVQTLSSLASVTPSALCGANGTGVSCNGGESFNSVSFQHRNSADNLMRIDQYGRMQLHRSLIAGVGFDIAEMFYSQEERKPRPGQVVRMARRAAPRTEAPACHDRGCVASMNHQTWTEVVPTESAYDTTAIGIVSTDPGVEMGVPWVELEPDDQKFGENLDRYESMVKVALAGRVPVQVTLEGGPIRIGDLLTTAPTEGKAMKAADPWRGGIVGTALEDYDPADPKGLPESGKILCMVHLNPGASADPAKVEAMMERTEELQSELSALQRDRDALREEVAGFRSEMAVLRAERTEMAELIREARRIVGGGGAKSGGTSSGSGRRGDEIKTSDVEPRTSDRPPWTVSAAGGGR